jgi:murein DD-endopeptidase MepM/ murein hydrolase activator NlpD
MPSNTPLPFGETPEEEILEENDPEESDKNTPSTGLIWNRLLRLGLGEPTLRIGTAVATGLLVLLVVIVMGTYFMGSQKSAVPTVTAQAVVPTPLIPLVNNPTAALISDFGIGRLAVLHTNLPAKPRTEIIKYEVVKGDTLFGIAEKFGIKPESILWSNRAVLSDNPAFLTPGQSLFIPPFDGIVHFWIAGVEGLNGVAKLSGVTPDAIIDWPGNKLDRNTLGDFSMPNIPDKTMIFIPNGVGQYTDWLPTFTRDNPAVAQIMGTGFCGKILDGPIGNGTFIWPTTETFLSGYDYSPSTNHFGIDIAGGKGNPIFAVDDGVVVYSGWNDNGYGNLLIIDHGNGWQSIYAHLNSISKGCGEFVFQGDVVAALGTTGRSTGPHLHFEMRNATYGKVNPWDFLIP